MVSEEKNIRSEQTGFTEMDNNARAQCCWSYEFYSNRLESGNFLNQDNFLVEDKGVNNKEWFAKNDREHIFQGQGLGPVRFNDEGEREVHFLALGGGDSGFARPLPSHKNASTVSDARTNRPLVKRRPGFQ